MNRGTARRDVAAEWQSLNPMHRDEMSRHMSVISQIDLRDLVGQFDDVAQLTADEKTHLEETGIQFAAAAADEAGPVRAAALELEGGSQYLLVEHFAHPDRFIDIRAPVHAGTSRGLAERFLAAAGVPEAHVRWIRGDWSTI